MEETDGFPLDPSDNIKDIGKMLKEYSYYVNNVNEYIPLYVFSNRWYINHGENYERVGRSAPQKLKEFVYSDFRKLYLTWCVKFNDIALLETDLVQRKSYERLAEKCARVYIRIGSQVYRETIIRESKVAFQSDYLIEPEQVISEPMLLDIGEFIETEDIDEPCAPPDIGEFDTLSSAGSLILNKKSTDYKSVIKSLNATNINKYTVLDGSCIIRKSICDKLIAFIDERGNGEMDFKVNLTKHTLETMIGKDVTQNMIDLFKSNVDEIKIRRVESDKTDKIIDFHLDHAYKTMQVSLNNDTEYKGGRLVYIMSDGIYRPPRKCGTITIHDNTIPHGVSVVEEGVRYGLFFLKTK